MQAPSPKSLFFVEVVFRRGIELPAMAIALRDLLVAFELLVVLVFDTDSAADVVDDVLIGRRVVATGCFVAVSLGPKT